MPWTVELYDRSVADELDSWPVDLRSRLLHIVNRIETHGLDRVGMPLVKHLRGKLWEMRPSGNRVEGRAVYVAASGSRGRHPRRIHQEAAGDPQPDPRTRRGADEGDFEMTIPFDDLRRKWLADPEFA